MDYAGVVFRDGTFADVVVLVTVDGGVDGIGAFKIGFVEVELEFEFGFVERVAD